MQLDFYSSVKGRQRAHIPDASKQSYSDRANEGKASVKAPECKTDDKRLICRQYSRCLTLNGG